MKITDFSRREYLRRASLREMRKREKLNSKAIVKREQRSGFFEIKCPRILRLTALDARKKVISFIDSIHRHVDKGRKRLWIDFSGLEKVYAEGMIFVYAEISRLNNVKKLDVRSTPPKDKVVRQVFNKIGFSKLIKCSIKRTPESNRDDVATWFCASGEEVEGEKCKNILEKYQGHIATSLSRDLFTGMTEAMTNARQHAYIKERGDNLIHTDYYKPWWMFSQEVNGKLKVVFCDLGLGIPNTLPISHPGLVKSLIRKLGKDLTDSRAIEEAVTITRSRTEQSHRGKGLSQIVATIDNSEESDIIILSNKGSYRLAKGGDVRLYDFSTSIKGTIVCWQVSLPDSFTSAKAA